MGEVINIAFKKLNESNLQFEFLCLKFNVNSDTFCQTKTEGFVSSNSSLQETIKTILALDGK